MQVIHLPKGAGKTRRILEIAIKEDAYIVCSRCDRKHIHDMALSMGISPDKLRFMAYEEFANSRAVRLSNVVIDNVDVLLRKIARGMNVLAISVNLDDLQEPERKTR